MCHKYTLENSIFKTRYWKNWVPTGIRMEWDSYMSSQDWGSQILGQILSEYHLVQVFLRIPIPLYTLMSWASTLCSKLSLLTVPKPFIFRGKPIPKAWDQVDRNNNLTFATNFLLIICYVAVIKYQTPQQGRKGLFWITVWGYRSLWRDSHGGWEFEAFDQTELVVREQREINDGAQLIFFFAATLECLTHSQEWIFL